MNCRHRFCIYQKDCQCTLENVSLDEIGMCYECICISLTEEELTKAKEEVLERYAALDYGE